MNQRPGTTRPWWAQAPVDPGEFAMLRVEQAVDVLWNLCSVHGQLYDLIIGLETKRERHVEATVNAIIKDLARV